MGSRCYSPNVGEALRYAAELHSSQRRKGKTEPYLSHVLAVCGLVAHYGGTEDQIIAAALHDAAEDQGGEATAREIGNRFGPDVESIVRDCSDSLAASGADKAPWRERKQAYLNRLEVRGVGPSTLVEACDKLANLQDIVEDLCGPDGVETLSRFSGKADGVRWYYSELGRVLISQVPEISDRYGELLKRLIN